MWLWSVWTGRLGTKAHGSALAVPFCELAEDPQAANASTAARAMKNKRSFFDIDVSEPGIGKR
jgi:hypothetical protein